jgi:hypothetical protein
LYARRTILNTQENDLKTRKLHPLLAALLIASLALSSCVAVPAPMAAPATAAPVERAAAPEEALTSEPTTAPTAVESSAVPFDLGAATLDQGSAVTDRLRMMPVRLTGMIAAPPTGDNLPIAVVIHGSHGSGCASTDGMTEEWPCPDSEKRHFEGFAYLLEALARQGYVALAINANPVYAMAYGETDTPRRMPVLFDLYMAQLAAAGRGETADFGIDLKGRLDLGRVAVLGHSQGGAGVNTIMKSRAGRDTPEQINAGQGPIAAAILLAPSGSGDPEGRLTAPSAVILPACDRDIAGLDGQDYYERQRLKSDSGVPVVSVLLQRANHNRFNSALEDEQLANQTAACSPEALLAPEVQRSFLAEYAPRFFDDALGINEDEAALLGLDGARPAPAALFGREVLTSLALPSAQRLRLPLDPAGAGGSATAIDCPREFTAEGGRREACRRLQISQPANPEELAVSWDGPGGVYEVALPPDNRDLSGYRTLHLRAVIDPLSELNVQGKPQAFSLRLTDGSGATAVVPLAGEPALAFPLGMAVVYANQPDRPVWDTNLLLGSIRAPLAKFAGVDLSDIRSVALVFDATDSGAIFVTDLELLRNDVAHAK